MKSKDLNYDKTKHVMYSKTCQKVIKKKLALHYNKDEVENIYTKIQLQYVDFLNNWDVTLGGKKNFHNGKGGTYDCIALMSYYVVCKDVTNLKELGEMEESLFLPAFHMLKFVDCNKPFFKKLMYKSFLNAKKQCDKWQDYKMNLDPFEKDKPIYYEFTECPVASFAREHNLLETMPAFCNGDYTAMELINAKLVRTTTCAIGDRCDYTICGSKDEYIKLHEEYIDELGYRRNK